MIVSQSFLNYCNQRKLVSRWQSKRFAMDRRSIVQLVIHYISVWVSGSKIRSVMVYDANVALVDMLCWWSSLKISLRWNQLCAHQSNSTEEYRKGIQVIFPWNFRRQYQFFLHMSRSLLYLVPFLSATAAAAILTGNNPTVSHWHRYWRCTCSDFLLCAWKQEYCRPAYLVTVCFTVGGMLYVMYKLTSSQTNIEELLKKV
jgi:hypothetical protein